MGMPRERPGDKFGTSHGHPGRLGRFLWKFAFEGQNVRGTDDGLSGPVLRDTARLSQRYPLIARYGVFGVST